MAICPPKHYIAKNIRHFCILYAKLHLTFKIDDVPAHLKKQTVGLRWVGWNMGEGGVGASP